MSAERRLRRKMERDIRKGILRPNKNVKELNLPTIEDIQEYINQKLKEKQDGLQLQEETRTDTDTITTNS